MKDQDLYAQETEFALLEILVLTLTKKTFVDIGAEKGAFAGFLMQHGFQGVVFEPCPKHHAGLEKLTENTDSSFLPYAIDSQDRTADFHLSYDENGKLQDFFHSLHKLTDDDRVQHRDSFPVKCRSLQSLADQGTIGTRIGILKTDTEGNDLNVLKGVGSVRAEVLICEFFTEGLYAGWELAHPSGLIAEAAKLGFNHYLAIKKKQGREMLSWNPAAFTEGQWGNLIFMTETVYHRCFEDLHALVAQHEVQLLEGDENGVRASLEEQVEALRATCAERLELIDYLHEETAKRLEIIERLESELQEHEAS